MHRLRRLAGLSARERLLLLQATILMATVRVGLKALPFAALRQVLRRLGTPSKRLHDGSGVTAAQVIWAVETAGRQVSFIGTCLTQALVAHVMLSRRGHPSNLRIGVKRDVHGTFTAHAWLERDGHVLIGGEPHHNFVPMPVLNGLDL